jgi:hypothetical protein
MKTYPLLDYVPRHEDVLVVCRYSSSHSLPRHYMEVSDQLQDPTALPPDNYWIGGCVKPKGGLDAVARRESPTVNPAGNWTPVVQPLA